MKTLKKSSKRRTRNPTRDGKPGRYRTGSTILTDEQRITFLRTLGEGWSPTKAAIVANAPRGTFYTLRGNDENFRIAWDAAVECGSDILEDAARDRSINGWEEPVFYQGEACGKVRKFSDTLLMFQLNGRRPEKYRQNVKVDAPDLAHSFAAMMMAATQRQVGTKDETPLNGGSDANGPAAQEPAQH